MALSSEEKQIVRNLKRAGKSNSEIAGIIGGRRLGRVEDPQANEKSASGYTSTNVFQRIISDIPSDIGETFRGIGESVQRGQETARDVESRVFRGETSPVSGTLQTIGGGLRAGAEAIGETGLGLAKLFTTERVEERIGEGVGAAAESVAQTAPVQAAVERFQQLPEETQRNIGGAAGVGEGIAVAAGFGPVVQRFKSVLSDTAQASLRKSDEILDAVRQKNAPDRQINVPEQASSLIRDLRFTLSDRDPQVDTVLQRSTFDDVNRHFQSARNAARDPAKPTPLEIAGDKAEEAFSAVSAARQAAVQGKKDILQRVADRRVPGNTINDVMSRGIQSMNDRFGTRISAKGEVTQGEGRTLQFDSSDQRLVEEYFSRLNALGVSPTVRQVDDFVDWAQSQLYKQSKTISKFEVASEPVVQQLQRVTGDLNTRLKDTVGGGYGEVNARISRLIELQDELSRALGADARKGGGLMKRLFSPTGGNTREIFQQVRDETGIDLVKEATLARFAMEGVGDVRQKNLLQELDALSQGASEFSILNPMSLIRFVRERADLDAQELANEIIRRSNASGPSSGGQ